VKAVEMQTFRAREIATDATVVVCREVTGEAPAAVELHDADVCFRLFADNAVNPVFRVQQGVVRYVNRAAVALLGAAGPEQLLGRPLGELLDGPSRATVEDDSLRAQADGGRPLPLTMLALDGGAVGVLARVTLVPTAHGLEVMVEATPHA